MTPKESKIKWNPDELSGWFEYKTDGQYQINLKI